MTLTHILVFAAVSLAAGAIPRARKWILCAAGILAVYWMQPALPVRNLDFWLPTGSVGLAACVWALTAGKGGGRRENAAAAAVVAAAILAVALTRYVAADPFLTPSRPPQTEWVLIALLAAGALFASAWMIPARRWILAAAVAAILALFIILKTDSLAQAAAGFLRRAAGQSAEFASPLDIRWLGFSYIAFRLIHTLRDRMTGRLPECDLREFLAYIVFPPAVAAGPIDRIERFLKDLRAAPAPIAELFPPGAERIAAGIFKKFVLADGLAVLALSAANADQIAAGPWTWFFLYAYALRIYFDFAGYTDIAVGLGRWAGVTLPENFNRPYLQPNLTAFWNSWHMTLAQWFRSYFFNPLTRALRTGSRRVPMGLIILAGQLATMALIGLWHGVSWNFLLWGCWHGFGLFVHNRWSEWSKARVANLESRPLAKKTYTAVGTLATFHFVVLGWVWFALPSVANSARVFLRLFGASG
ncbi:MAG: MBOAT family protein [Anaerolineales bacterium]|nr:MBOAT family protein [Anaerolineales bacterium]